ncbi:MAG TPA: MBL fold metallo-hydrolase [Candidatus Binataceae bacterium]|nr:MBL fold metallo-hydrolase [Candidatus Binataceae bacterium]
MNASADGKPISLTMLGTGDAFASGGSAQAIYFIEAAGTGILMEAGPEVVGALKRAAIKPGDIDLVLISHLHGDHYGGLPFLFLEYMFESPLDHTITIAGPRNLEPRCWRLVRTLFPKIEFEKLKRKFRFAVLEPKKSARFGKVRVSAIRSPHTNPDISLSLRIEADGKSIVFSGDSGWNEELVPFSAGADLFLCECTYFESADLAFHMNYPQLAANRSRFNVRRMLLTHIGREVLNHKPEVEIEMAFDGMRIEL